MEWINVEDRLPEDLGEIECAEYYLVNIDRFVVHKAMFMNGDWMSSYTSKIVKEVTHWMPINKPNL